MMQNERIKYMRMPTELKKLHENTHIHGITCSETDDSLNFSHLIAIIPGPKGTPYEDGKFKINIQVLESYPFRPPAFTFLTPVFHPNVDTSGKICMSLLRIPPSGTYNPAVTLEAVLLSIQLLLATPNADDPIRVDAADLYKSNRQEYNRTARELTKKHCAPVEK
ncbi:ubiquitin-conjugating enzyme E2 T-like [Teleopsis dalmanni]|uniref:ubiquitin-conjugating enzyme E2 T-like n=1 Tax=Teleopsis dalmanni TaxID=139649 RepID=UPI0018CF3D44|nr:ubiquitin-conjugating enzyme E2 T-like [Teleopsis dalmanni]